MCLIVRGLTLQVIELCRPSDSRLEHVDFECLFSSLSLRLLLRVFASLLLERRVIFTADKLRCVAAFYWWRSVVHTRRDKQNPCGILISLFFQALLLLIELWQWWRVTKMKYRSQKYERRNILAECGKKSVNILKSPFFLVSEVA